MTAARIRRLLRPDRYVLALFAFFVLFPVFMDFITPDVIRGFAGGTVDAQGNVVSRYEGGTGPAHQWYYPILYPFIVLWYVPLLLFGLVDAVVPLSGPGYYVVQTVYLYLVAVALVRFVGWVGGVVRSGGGGQASGT